MLRTLLSTALACASLACTALPALAAPAAPPRSELGLAGLKPGDPAAQVRKRLGAPTETQGSPKDHDYSLYYPGLRIDLLAPGEVLLLESTSPRHCTPSGLCPGQPLSEARKRWGEGTAAEDGTLQYDSDDEACWLEAEPDESGQRIATITVACP